MEEEDSIPEFEIDQISQQVGRSLSKRFFDNFDNDETVPLNYEDLELSDVNSNLLLLKNQVRIAQDYGSTFPSQKVGSTYIPINLDFFNKGHFEPLNPFDRFLFEELFQRTYQNNLTSKSIFPLAFSTLKENVRTELSRFIAVRHASFFGSMGDLVKGFFKKLPPTNAKTFTNDGGSGGTPPSSSATKYLTVTVNTAHSGLQIKASPCYLINYQYFGAPSTPVTGPLLPGVYVFCGQGVSLPSPAYDNTPVSIPPNLNITLHGL